MVSRRFLRSCLSAVLGSACTLAHAQEKAIGGTQAEVPVLTVIAPGDPVEKSYRKMILGMDLFERRRRLAPSASLRFKLLPRRKDTNMSRVDVEIVGETVSLRVPVAADSTFTLERIPKAWEEDASVQANRKTLTMTWRAEIRTPGLPDSMRRLGDLRLECQVGMEAGLISNVRNAPGLEHCDQPRSHYFFFSDRPLFSVTLVSGSRRQTLPVQMMYANALDHPMSKRELSRCDCEVLLDRAFYLPLGDASWPDDTRVVYEYMDEKPHAVRTASVANAAAATALQAVTVGRSTKSEVIAALGRSAALRFESGFEVWAYRFDEPKTRSKESSRQAELAILFAPSGVAAKTRLGLTATADGS